MGLVAEAQSLRASLASFDPAAVAPDDCVAVVEELARTEKACAVARARAAARVAEAGAFRTTGFRDPAEWLGRISGTSMGEAQRDLAAGRQLQGLSAATDAAVTGQLSLAQVEEIARTVQACPGSEREMLRTAKHESLTTLREQGRRCRERSVSVEHLHERQHEARSFRHWRDELGMVRVSGALMPEVGMPFVSRLEAETDRLRRGVARAERLATPWERHAADAFASMVTGQGTGASTRADIVYVWDLDRDAAHIVGGGPVPTDVVRDAARSASIKAVLHDGVTVTAVAHYGKAMPAHLRTALDLGPPPGFEGVACVDCGNGWHLEWDHVDPRANGGAWSLDNIEPRCWWCHVDKTERDRAAGLLGARGP